jgi:hypothetical protein
MRDRSWVKARQSRARANRSRPCLVVPGRVPSGQTASPRTGANSPSSQQPSRTSRRTASSGIKVGALIPGTERPAVPAPEGPADRCNPIPAAAEDHSGSRQPWSANSASRAGAGLVERRPSQRSTAGLRSMNRARRSRRMSGRSSRKKEHEDQRRVSAWGSGTNLVTAFAMAATEGPSWPETARTLTVGQDHD